MKTKKSIFILSSLTMLFVLTGSLSAKDFFEMIVDNKTNKAIVVTVFDSRGKEHEFNLEGANYQSRKIFGEENERYYGFGSSGSKFRVKITDPTKEYKNFEQEYQFTGKNMVKDIPLVVQKTNEMGIPKSYNIKMEVEVYPKDIITVPTTSGGGPRLNKPPVMGEGSILIKFTGKEAQ